MLKLKIINRFILQWLFLRLVKCIENNGSTWYSIKGFVIPTTGYGNDFKYIGKPKFLRITKKKNKND